MKEISWEKVKATDALLAFQNAKAQEEYDKAAYEFGEGTLSEEDLDRAENKMREAWKRLHDFRIKYADKL